MKLLALAALCLAGSVLGQNPSRRDKLIESLSFPSEAFCNNRVPGYLVSDGYKLSAAARGIYGGIDQDKCSTICSDNKDINGQAMPCASFTYLAFNRTCMIHRDQSMPDAKSELVAVEGARYFEKICLPKGAPIECGEATFFRADQALLAGFAKNVTTAKTLEECLRTCILTKSFECKSVMYFPKDSDCILSARAAVESPELFTEHNEETVVYVENGCLLNNQVRAAIMLPAPVDEVEDAKEQELYGQWGAWSPCDRSDGRRFRTRVCKAGNKCSKARLMQTQWCKDIPTTTEKPTRTTAKPKPTTPAPTEATTKGPWGEWSGNCLPFPEFQPCQNNFRIGFETRPCEGEASLCQGPFFRYCLLPCTF